MCVEVLRKREKRLAECYSAVAAVERTAPAVEEERLTSGGRVMEAKNDITGKLSCNGGLTEQNNKEV